MIIVLSGGAAGLNFKVVGGTAQPASPAENTIWVNTGTAITEWIFSSTEPESPVEGMVWFPVGTSAAVSFNAIKKNGLWVYPSGCNQYISGAWVGKVAKTYQGGAWGEWSKYFIKSGELIDTLAGRLRANDRPTVTAESGYVRLYVNAGSTCGVAPSEKIDITGYKKITLVCNVISNSEYYAVGLSTALQASDESNTISNVIAKATGTATGTQTLECDITSFTGEYYPCILLKGLSNGGGSFDVRVFDFFLS